MPPEKEQNFVNGRYLANESGESFGVYNPATNRVIYQVEIADEKVLSEAVESAKRRFARWSVMTGQPHENPGLSHLA